jgi:hypothetical protein
MFNAEITGFSVCAAEPAEIFSQAPGR